MKKGGWKINGLRCFSLGPPKWCLIGEKEMMENQWAHVFFSWPTKILSPQFEEKIEGKRIVADNDRTIPFPLTY